jgi:hypothetical protein
MATEKVEVKATRKRKMARRTGIWGYRNDMVWQRQWQVLVSNAVSNNAWEMRILVVFGGWRRWKFLLWWHF